MLWSGDHGRCSSQVPPVFVAALSHREVLEGLHAQGGCSLLFAHCENNCMTSKLPTELIPLSTWWTALFSSVRLPGALSTLSVYQPDLSIQHKHFLAECAQRWLQPTLDILDCTYNNLCSFC